jgi:hypothetical protein
LDILPLGTQLQVEFTRRIEHVQVNHRMERLRAAVTFAARRRPDDVSLLVYEGEHFFTIIFH